MKAGKTGKKKSCRRLDPEAARGFGPPGVYGFVI
jgi:hypothetical protein